MTHGGEELWHDRPRYHLRRDHDADHQLKAGALKPASVVRRPDGQTTQWTWWSGRFLPSANPWHRHPAQVGLSDDLKFRAPLPRGGA